MKIYRIFFINDRGKKAGVTMYLAFGELSAESTAEAEEFAARKWPHIAPVKAIEWPATSKTSLQWLERHVGK